MAELKGNKYGTHRVIEPKGVLTQAAWKIDNDMSKVYSNEIVCDVTSLNIDSAQPVHKVSSFEPMTQPKQEGSKEVILIVVFSCFSLTFYL